MTSDTSFYMETVSLHDDESISSINDDLEGQIKLSESEYASSTPIMIDLEEEEEGGDNNENTEQVVVVVDHQEKVVITSSPPPTLPPLRLKEIQQEYDHDERDYVDTSLFSPEVTRHSLELAHRRARALENELRELEALEQMHTSPVTSSVVKITPLEAVAIISTAFTGSVSKMKQFLHGQNVEYNLLTGTSPLNKVDDLDTDGDGLQLSPDASRGNDGKHFIPSPKIKPALKRISVYSQLGKDHKRSNRQAPHTRRRLQWHEDVLDHDEEFIDEEGEAFEEESLMINGDDKKTLLRQSTPRSKKKRKKLVRSIMRRLTPYEKEELYKERPDLMIVPNWAQKYREEMTESESTRWSVWLMIIIGTLALLLLILIMLIARDQSVKTQVT